MTNDESIKNRDPRTEKVPEGNIKNKTSCHENMSVQQTEISNPGNLNGSKVILHSCSHFTYLGYAYFLILITNLNVYTNFLENKF